MSIRAIAFVEVVSGATGAAGPQGERHIPHHRPHRHRYAGRVPSVAWPDDAASKLALVALHALAAAIVVPALVRHAHE